MKVAAFLGSPRKSGNTARLLKEFLKGASENSGITIDEVFVQENKIAACTNCDYCKRSTGCIQNDDMQRIYPIVKEADVLVFAIPIYWWSMPAQLKALIDRFYAFKEGEIKGKKVYLLMTYGGALPNSGPELIERTFKDICDCIQCQLAKTYGACTIEYMPVEQNKEALREVYEIGRNILINNGMRG